VGTPPAWKPERRFEGESERIEREAARWLVVLDSEPNVANLRALHEWLAARARHRAAFLRLSVAWRKMDRLRALPGDRRPQPPRAVPSSVLYIIAFGATAAVAALLITMWIR
jgi:ferric-dicitrate binding protein FerR (iron transport regulator)